MGRRDFGQVRKLPSGRWQARFRVDGEWHVARPTDPGKRTHTTKGQAESALEETLKKIDKGTWSPAKRPAMPKFAGYAESWLSTRELRPRTRIHYRSMLERHLLPAFGPLRVDEIRPDLVREWRGSIERPTVRAHCYGLLRSILATAVADDLIAANPCRIRGGGSSKRQREVRPLTIAELAELVDAMPPRYRLMTLLAAWCGLRFGELTELRRWDVKDGRLRVERAVSWRRETGFLVGPPKSSAGVRTVAVPPHLLPALEAHLRTLPVAPDSLLFPSATNGHLQSSTVHKVFKPARERIGRPDLRWHDLRHTGAVLAAATGATLAELMARLGHSTQAAALVYQHAAEDRDQVIAEALSALAEATVTPISQTPARNRRTG